MITSDTATLRPSCPERPAERHDRPGRGVRVEDVGVSHDRRRLDERAELGPRSLGVLPVLEHRAERAGGARLVEHVASEGVQRPRPVDRLRDPGRLVQAHRAERLDRPRDLAGQLQPGLGDPAQHDRDLALEVGVLDPVVEGPALERVVDVAGAVRGEHHDRRHLGPEGPDLGHRHREVGQDLEQERLELVVGAVDLVDQEHRRRGVRPARAPAIACRSGRLIRNRSENSSSSPTGGVPGPRSWARR